MSATSSLPPTGSIDELDPVEVERLFRSALNARVVLPSEVIVAAKTAINAIRHGLSESRWSRAHYELLDSLVYRIALDDGLKHYKTGVVERGGIIHICCEVMLSRRACEPAVALAVAVVHRLCEVGTRRADTIALIVRTYVRCATNPNNRALARLHFGKIADMLYAAGDVTEGALCDEAKLLMTDVDWRVRASAVRTIGKLADPDTGLEWRPEAADNILAAIVTQAIRDEVAPVREAAADLTDWILDELPTVLSAGSISAIISALIQHARAQPALERLLRRLMRGAPEGPMEEQYYEAVRRLKESQDAGSSQEIQSVLFSGVLAAARRADEICKTDCVQRFVNILKTSPPLQPNVGEDVDDCAACYEKKANVVAVKSCTEPNCGNCACTKAHFCAQCTARIFIEAQNYFDDEEGFGFSPPVTCPMCRRQMCVADLRLLEVVGNDDDVRLNEETSE